MNFLIQDKKNLNNSFILAKKQSSVNHYQNADTCAAFTDSLFGKFYHARSWLDNLWYVNSWLGNFSVNEQIIGQFSFLFSSFEHKYLL